MTALPLHAIPVILDGQIRLRVHKGPRLELDMPLRSRQALVLAAQLLNLALSADISAADRSVLETPGKQDVAAGKRAHG